MAVILDEILRLYVMWMVLSWKSAVCQNANLVANPVQVPLGGSITLTCKYIGNESESAILWLNGSNTDIFTLTPGSTIPQCDVFSTVNASYDPSRLNYTCNEGSNIYTLTISPVQARDINVKWSCTFLDPSLNTAYSQITIKLPDPPTTSTSRNQNLLLLLLLILLILLILVFLIFICCGCLDCCKFYRIFDHYEESKSFCYVTWYFIKRGCCSFFFCKSGSKRGKCFCGYSTGERCGGCHSCRTKCACGWPGNCKSKKTRCGCCSCFCCVEEDEKVNEVTIDLNTKKSGSRSAVSRKDVELRMGEKDIKNDEERPPAFHLGTKHKVESETTSKHTRKFDLEEHRPLPPLGGEPEDKRKPRPQPRPPENSNIKDPNFRGLSANFDDTTGLATDMPRSSRLPPLQATKQPTVEEEVALEEPKKKRKKKNKKKDQLNEGNPEEEMAELKRNRKSAEDQVVSDED